MTAPTPLQGEPEGTQVCEECQSPSRATRLITARDEETGEPTPVYGCYTCFPEEPMPGAWPMIGGPDGSQHSIHPAADDQPELGDLVHRRPKASAPDPPPVEASAPACPTCGSNDPAACCCGPSNAPHPHGAHSCRDPFHDPAPPEVSEPPSDLSPDPGATSEVVAGVSAEQREGRPLLNEAIERTETILNGSCGGVHDQLDKYAIRLLIAAAREPASDAQLRAERDEAVARAAELDRFREKEAQLQRDAPEGMRVLNIWAYEKWPKLVIWRCRSCGSTGPAGSTCGPHDGGFAGPIQVPRSPCTVCDYDEEPIHSETRVDLEEDAAQRVAERDEARAEAADLVQRIASWLRHIDRLDEINGAKWPGLIHNPLWDASFAIEEKFGKHPISDPHPGKEE